MTIEKLRKNSSTVPCGSPCRAPTFLPRTPSATSTPRLISSPKKSSSKSASAKANTKPANTPRPPAPNAGARKPDSEAASGSAGALVFLLAFPSRQFSLSAMLLRARVVLPVAQPPIDDGAVWISGNRIRSVGRWRDMAVGAGEQVEDLGEAVLLPGLVNAHCHLDYTDLAGEIPATRLFTDWIKSITTAKAGKIY